MDFFLEGITPLTIILGSAGIGKTEQVKRKLESRKNVCYISGYMTKTQFVKTLYEHRDDYIVIDDTDNLFADASIFGILRCAFDTGNERTVDYYSPSPFVGDIPRSFTITAPMLIITNGLKESHAMTAFKSRAICINFKPSILELVNKLKEIVKTSKSIINDADVLALYEKFAPVSAEPTFRAYILSTLLKSKGIDWRKHLRESMRVNPLIGHMITATETHKNHKERVKLFKQLSGKSASTYNRLLKEYREVVSSENGS